MRPDQFISCFTRAFKEKSSCLYLWRGMPVGTASLYSSSVNLELFFALRSRSHCMDIKLYCSTQSHRGISCEKTMEMYALQHLIGNSQCIFLYPMDNETICLCYFFNSAYIMPSSHYLESTHIASGPSSHSLEAASGTLSWHLHPHCRNVYLRNFLLLRSLLLWCYY